MADDFASLTPTIRVECFLLCDAAQEVGGKLFILGGGWDGLVASSFPWTHPHFAIAMRLAVPWVEANRPRQFRIHLRDEDGNEVLRDPMEGGFNVGRPPNVEPGDDLPVLLAISVSGVTYPRPGDYTYHLLIDGEERARARVRARLARRT